MDKEEIIQAITGIDKMIDRINYLAMKHVRGPLSDLEQEEYRGYSIKYTLWINGIKLDGMSAQEYVDNYHLFEQALKVCEYSSGCEGFPGQCSKCGGNSEYKDCSREFK